MITQTVATWQTSPWKEDLRNAVTEVDELLALLSLDGTPLAAEICRNQRFPLRVPRPFIARMTPGDANDPLLRQVLPLQQENVVTPGFSTDPLEEARYNPVPGLIHKYHGRALLITSPACAIHCRYCFRRHFPYQDNNPGKAQWQGALDYLRADSSINEVILSGGDPLATNDQHLSWLVNQLDAIPQLQRLRIHTRLPVTIPGRIDDDCLKWLGNSRLKKVVVLHINHGNEIDKAVADMAQRLKTVGIELLNQSVLLRGVNDNADTLVQLQEKLFATGILPYYLHLLDPVAGAAHFEVPEQNARALHLEMQARLPGYLVPRLVRDLPGQTSKTLLLGR